MLLDTRTKKLSFATFVAAFLALSFLLNQVFSGRIILPQSFNIGPLTVHYYGIVMVVAVLAGYWLAKKRAARYGIGPQATDDLIFWAVIGGFVGARIYHVLSSWQYYVQHPSDILKVWQGGLSIYGLIFGGMIALWLYKKILNLHPVKYPDKSGPAFGGFNRVKSLIFNLFDWLTPSVALGQIIGRFGNLLNYEALGYPTGLPWKMFVPPAFRPAEFLSHPYFHPFFLYETLGSAVILLFLLKFHKNSRAGSLSFTYLLLYNVLRFFLEFMRVDSTFVGIWRLNAIMSLALIILATVCLLAIKRHEKNVQIS